MFPTECSLQYKPIRYMLGHCCSKAYRKSYCVFVKAGTLNKINMVQLNWFWKQSLVLWNILQWKSDQWPVSKKKKVRQKMWLNSVIVCLSKCYLYHFWPSDWTLDLTLKNGLDMVFGYRKVILYFILFTTVNWNHISFFISFRLFHFIKYDQSSKVVLY